jgi:nucleoside-diphosphate-sugar epimerase
VEAVLGDVLDDAEIDAYIFRPCIVAGPRAPMLIEQIPYVRWADRVPSALRGVLSAVPGVRPVLPDPGVPFQLVHHDDVALALRAGVLGRGRPGAYNLAGPGTVTMGDVARAMGYVSVRVPGFAVDATAEVVARLPAVPDEVTWIEAVRRPTLMDTARARRLLRWRPKWDAPSTLRATVSG